MKIRGVLLIISFSCLILNAYYSRAIEHPSFLIKLSNEDKRDLLTAEKITPEIKKEVEVPSPPLKLEEIPKIRVSPSLPKLEERKEITKRVAPRKKKREKIIPRVKPIKKKAEEIVAKPEEIPSAEVSKPAEGTVSEIIKIKEEVIPLGRRRVTPPWLYFISSIVALAAAAIILFLLWQRIRELRVQRKESEGTSVEGVTQQLVAPEKFDSPQAKLWGDTLRELKITYKGVEKVLSEWEEKLAPIAALEGKSIEEVAKAAAEEVKYPIEKNIQELQLNYQSLYQLFLDTNKKLASFEPLAKLNMKELIQQTSQEFYRTLEQEFQKFRITHQEGLKDLEAKLDKKITATGKHTKDLEKLVLEVDKRVVALDSLVTSMALRDSAAVLRPIRVKAGEEKPSPAVLEKEKKIRDALYQQIYQLAEEGATVEEIAQKTKIGKGEIQLILGLRGKRE
jgi:hypothetical protein